MAENLGTLNFDVTVTNDSAKKSLNELKAIIDSISSGVKITVSSNAHDEIAKVREELSKLQSAATNISINTNGLENIQIRSFNPDQSAVEALAKKVADAISAEPIKFKHIDTTSITSDIATAIKNGVEMSKGSVMDRLKKALSGSVGKIRIDIDPKTIIESIEKALNSRSVKIGGVSVNKEDLTRSIREALKNEVFYIKISIDKSQLNNIGNAAAAGNSVGNGFNHAAAGARNFNGNLRPLSTQMKTTTQIATLLGNSIGNLFSVYAMKNFLEGIVQIGGELEKQKMALGAIIGDAEKAKTIFRQVSELSMISPFDVQDLVTYTKQLSAFGIEYDKLYDTTKRLSDLAAGVGVSFGRIAYEFGQTSARGWLDGRELRMFSNSGIPLLQKLSDLYTQLRGEVVTASQVREMVTNRQVSFEDVETVIKQMTDEGGEFYQMQEVMAESLSAKWRNLANDWNLMLGTMAESPIGGALKWVAESLMKIVENWKRVLWFAAASTMVWQPFKLLNYWVGMANKNMPNLSHSLSRAEKVSYGMGKSWNSLKNTLKSNWIGLTAAAVAGLAAAFAQAVHEQMQFNETISGLSGRIGVESRNSQAEFDSMLKKLELARGSQEEYAHLIDVMKNKYGSYLKDLSYEAEGYENIAKQANAAKDAIAEKVRSQQYEKAYDSITEKYGKRIAKMRDSFVTMFSEDYGKLVNGQEKNMANDLHNLLDDLVNGSISKDQIEKYFKDVYKFTFDENVWNQSPIDTYIKLLKTQKRLIEDITKQAGGVDLYRNITDPINKYYDLLIKSTTDKNKKLLFEIEKNKKLVEAFTEGGTKIGNKFVKGTTGALDQKDKYEKKIDEITAMLESKWYKVSNDIFSRPFKYSVGKNTNKDYANTIFSDLGTKKDETDYLAYFERLYKKRKELKDSIEKRGGIDFDSRNSVNDQNRYQLEKEELKRLNELAKELGFNWEMFDTKKKETTRQDDKELAAWKERAKLINEAYQEYKKYYDLYQDSDKAKRLVKENPLFASLDVDPSAIISNYDKLISIVKSKMGDVKQRRMFELDLEGQRFNIKFDLDKDYLTKQIEAAVADINQIINDNRDNYDYFKKVYEATGDSNYAKKWSEFMSDQVYSLLNVDRDFNIDQLIMADDPTLRQYVNEEKQLKALKIALEEYNKALENEKKERLQAILSGKKYLQTYKDEIVALNAQYAKLIGINIEDGLESMLTIPEDADEEVKNLYKAYMQLYNGIITKADKGMPWMNDITIAKNNLDAGLDDKSPWLDKFGDVVSQAAKDTGAVLQNMSVASEKAADFAESMTFATEVIAQFASGNYLGSVLSILGKGISIMAEESKTNQEHKKNQRTNERLKLQLELLTDSISRLADAIDEGSTISERMYAYNEQLKLIEQERETYAYQLTHMNYRDRTASDFNIGGVLSLGADSAYLKKWLQAQTDTGSNDLITVLERFYEIANESEKSSLLQLFDSVNLREAAEGLVGLKDEIKKINEEIEKANLGFNFDDLKTSFIDTLMDMDSTSHDFWDNFAEYAVKASMNEFVGKNLQSQLESVYNSFAEDFSADGKVDQSAIDNWRKQVDRIYGEAQKQAEYLNEIWGRGEEDEGMSSSIKGVTEDTAEIIAAYLNTIAANQTNNRACGESIAYEQLPMLQMTADSQLTQLQMQTEHLQAIRESNLVIAERMQNLDDNFSAAIAGTKTIHMN